MNAGIRPFFPFAAISLVLFLGCGQSKNTGVLESPSRDPVSETSDFPAVVMVFLPNGGFCSGTFIGPSTVLTAAHCAKDAGAYRIIAPFGTFTTSHREVLGTGTVSDANDIALLILIADAAQARKAQIMPVAGQISLSDTVRLVGYGCNDMTTSNGGETKRTGTNQIYQLDSFIELLTPNSVTAQSSRGLIGPTNRAGSCFGDSGGPLLRQHGTDNYYDVIGVCHAGGPSGSNEVSQYIDITRADNLKFLTDTDSRLSLHLFDTCLQPETNCGYQSASMQIVSFLQLIWTKFIALFW